MTLKFSESFSIHSRKLVRNLPMFAVEKRRIKYYVRNEAKESVVNFFAGAKNLIGLPSNAARSNGVWKGQIRVPARFRQNKLNQTTSRQLSIRRRHGSCQSDRECSMKMQPSKNFIFPKPNRQHRRHALLASDVQAPSLHISKLSCAPAVHRNSALFTAIWSFPRS